MSRNDSSSRRGSIETPATTGASRAFLGLTIAVSFGLFASGGPLQIAQGGMAVAAGLAMALAPPALLLPRSWWAAAAAVLILAALEFLPRGWGYDPEWRRGLEALGIRTGGQITAHPSVSFQHWLRLATTLAVGLWILGHRLTDRGHALMLTAVTWLAGVYGVVSILLFDHKNPWIWDPVDTFGLFPNRSHTATLLVIGTLTGLTTATYHIRHQHGGRAALATLPGLACLAALLGFSVSRAGLLLLGLGLIAWLAGLKMRDWSKRGWIAAASVTVAVAGLFLYSDAEIKSRLLTPSAHSSAHGTFADPSDFEFDLGIQGDGRWLIYRDTATLIRDSWMTGIGRGMFEHVMPQYRRLSASETRCVHPESDWLLLAAETGIPCAAVLALLVALVTLTAAQPSTHRRGRTLRWGGLVAALVVPIHGIFDTPGHLPVLCQLAVLLVAAALRPPLQGTTIASPARTAWRLTGLGVAGAGAFLLYCEITGRPTPVVAAAHAANEAARLYQEDQAALHTDPGNHASTIDSQPTNDPLRTAITATERGLAIAPLDSLLHYRRGMLALHFDDMDSTAIQSLDAQRLLDPMPTWVTLSQARGWIAIDPDRTVALWEESLRRAQATTAVSNWGDPGTGSVPKQILNQAQATPALMPRALDLVRSHPGAIQAWIGEAPTALLDTVLPTFLDGVPEIQRQVFIQARLKRGNKHAVEAYRTRQ